MTNHFSKPSTLAFWRHKYIEADEGLGLGFVVCYKCGCIVSYIHTNQHNKFHEMLDEHDLHTRNLNSK